jgi:tRNA modification GTPase
MPQPTDRAFLLTPPGGAAIAVVRICGPGVGPFLARHFSKTAPPNRAVHGDLSDGTQEIDDPVVVVSDGGAIADINLHGGPWVVRSVLELARRCGFEVAPAGAAGVSCLPPESVDADSDLEREILASLPLARTELGVRALLAQKDAWARCDGSSAEIERMRNDRGLWWLLHPPRVAIVGRANVGKSTLANQLFAQERSITADMPGTTRDWVGEVADVDGLPVMLVDTPGMRQTDDPIEAVAIARAGEQIASADLVIVVVDASEAELADSGRLSERHPGAICVLNKCDRASTGKKVWPAAIRTVATSGEGVSVLRAAITARFGCNDLYVTQARCWTERQFRAFVAHS